MHEKDVYHITKSQLLANMDAMMGGRAAEELIFGPEKVTTGASSDLMVRFLIRATIFNLVTFGILFYKSFLVKMSFVIH